MPTNHNTGSLDLFTMVFTRLPFLADTPENRTRISSFAVEIMNELEPCFKVDKEDPDPTHVGDEQYYSIAQLAVVADLIAVYILLVFMTLNIGGLGTMGGSTPTPAALTTFLKRTKAGSVEAEWEAFDVKSTTGMVIGGDKLLAVYKASAMRKARNLGCIIDICEDCSLAVSCVLDQFRPADFIVRTEC